MDRVGAVSVVLTALLGDQMLCVPLGNGNAEAVAGRFDAEVARLLCDHLLRSRGHVRIAVVASGALGRENDGVIGRFWVGRDLVHDVISPRTSSARLVSPTASSASASSRNWPAMGGSTAL